MRIIFIAVQSMNGLMTRGDEPGTGFATEADRQWFRECLNSLDLVIMGGNTYRAARESILCHRSSGPPRLVITRDPGGFTGDQLEGRLEFMTLDRQILLDHVEAGDLKKIGLVGGPGLSSWFFDEGLVDEIYLTIEPVLFAAGASLTQLQHDVPCTLLSVRPLSMQTILLHYKVGKGK